jgi:SAM-dependent MidA family methyltransferase
MSLDVKVTRANSSLSMLIFEEKETLSIGQRSLLSTLNSAIQHNSAFEEPNRQLLFSENVSSSKMQLCC